MNRDKMIDKLIELKCFLNNEAHVNKMSLFKYGEEEIIVNFLTNAHRMVNCMIEELYDNQFKLFDIAPYELNEKELKRCLESKAIKNACSGLSQNSDRSRNRKEEMSLFRGFVAKVLAVFRRK